MLSAYPNRDLSSLVGSRICHDLISPIGAIGNGVELLQMAPRDSAAELDLITDSVDNAAARIRFFRVAFGAAGDQMMGRAEVISILSDLSAASRFDCDWCLETPQTRVLVRLAFLGLQCLETAMPYGGKITFESRDTMWRITGCAQDIRFDPDLWASLTDHRIRPALSPAQVQFGLLPLLAQEAGRVLSSGRQDAEVHIAF
jgi:histidine phosphotransferase ChpT